jgi:hypothetical protein
MKIKELLTEGPLDYVKGFIKGGRPEAQAASQQAQGQKQLQWYADQVFKMWNTYSGQTGDTDVETWAKNFFKAPNVSYAPADEKPASIKNYLTQLSRDYKAGNLQQGTVQPKVQSPVKTLSPKATASQQGFTVVNREPIIVRYLKKDYGLNGRGEWYQLGSRGSKAPLIKDVDPTLEKMLDKAAEL